MRDRTTRRDVLGAATAMPLALTGDMAAGQPIERAAVAAARSNGAMRSFAIRSDMARADPLGGTVALLTEPGRAGLFRWRDAVPREAAADPRQILFVPGARGCWIRDHDGVLDSRWAGAVADPRRDQSDAINATIALANLVGASVRIPAGRYGIAAPVVNMGAARVTGAGCAGAARPAHPGTTFVALTAGMLMYRHGDSDAQLAGVGFDGAGLAATAVLTVGTARIVMRDVHAVACTRIAFLFDACQNGLFENLCSRFSTVGFCLMNGARNNIFLHATSEVNERYFKGDFGGSCAIQLLIDVTDPFGWGTSRSVTRAGNDENRFIGGIHERVPLGIRVLNPAGYTEGYADAGRLTFSSVEFAANQILSTDTRAYAGLIVFDDCDLLTGRQDIAASVGVLGRVEFRGACRFSGSAIAGRGWSVPSNVLQLIGFDSQAIADARDPGLVAIAGASFSVDPATRAITLRPGGSPAQGIGFVPGGSFVSGNSAVLPATLAARTLLFRLSFAIDGLGAGEQVELQALLNRPPFRRPIGRFGSGAHELVSASQPGDNGSFALARGTARGAVRVLAMRIAVA